MATEALNFASSWTDKMTSSKAFEGPSPVAYLPIIIIIVLVGYAVGPSPVAYLPIIIIIVFVGYAVGLAAIPFLIMGEMLPAR